MPNGEEKSIRNDLDYRKLDYFNMLQDVLKTFRFESSGGDYLPNNLECLFFLQCSMMSLDLTASIMLNDMKDSLDLDID